MSEILLRFVIGGVVVSVFAMFGDVFRPKSFAGLFGAAPSVALATLGLTVMHEGKRYAAFEARSMVAGAVGFCLYAALVSWVGMRWKLGGLRTTLTLIPVWFAVSFAGWMMMGAPR